MAELWGVLAAAVLFAAFGLASRGWRGWGGGGACCGASPTTCGGCRADGREERNHAEP